MMKKGFSSVFDILLRAVYEIGRSTVLAISRYSAYQPVEDGELFEMIYRDKE